MRRRISIVLFTVLMLLCLASCKTIVEVRAEIPEFNPMRPERPELVQVPADSVVAVQVNINMVKLISYIEQLEAYADGWETYYEELRNDGQ